MQVGYKQHRNYILTPSRKHLGKHIARGSKLAVARDCMEDPELRNHIVKKVGVRLQQELANLCSSEVLLGDHSKLASFTWDLVLAAAKQHAPTLLEILQACSSKKKAYQDRSKAVIGMCIAILCKHRQCNMSLVQKILSIILYAGHCSKMVCIIMQIIIMQIIIIHACNN